MTRILPILLALLLPLAAAGGLTTSYNPMGAHPKSGSGAEPNIMVEVVIPSDGYTLQTPVIHGVDTYVDFGDETAPELWTQGRPQHTYALAGTYILTVSGDITEFGVRLYPANDTWMHCVTRVLSLDSPVPMDTYSSFGGCTNLTYFSGWGDNVISVNSTFSGCVSLGNLPPWGERITSASSCYRYCTSLTGLVPPFGVSITNAYGTFYGCSSLEGFAADFSWANVEIAGTGYTDSGCFHGCTSLAGAVPPWGDKLTTVSRCFYGCSGLTGNIPPWGPNIVNAQNTYTYCSHLTGVWDGATDADLMPERITSFRSCVLYTTSSLRAFFTSGWGGTKQ